MKIPFYSLDNRLFFGRFLTYQYYECTEKQNGGTVDIFTKTILWDGLYSFDHNSGSYGWIFKI